EKKNIIDKSPTWLRLLLFFALWILISIGYTSYMADKQIEEISYSEFKKKVAAGKVASIEIKGRKITGQYAADEKETSEKESAPEEETDSGEEAASDADKEAAPDEKTVSDRQASSDKASDKASDKKQPAPQPDGFSTVMPTFEDPELIRILEKNKVEIHAEPDDTNWLARALISFLPWLLLIGFFVYMNKRMKEQMGGLGGPKGPFGFGKSKAKKIQKEEVDVTFEDVAGLENAKKELKEMSDYLKDPSAYIELGAELPKGILLVGPPGTGKTLMSRAMAGEASVPFYSISGSEFIEMFVGVGASRVRDMFKKAKKNAPSLIFIDELDSIGRVRGTGVGGGHDEREQTLNQILSEIDGFGKQESVIVLAATNRPDVLDPALIRPGRFDRRISLEMPRKEARKKILKVHLDKVKNADDMDYNLLAGATVGFSGADLKNLVNEATLLAARKGKEQVEMEDFHESRDKIMMGIKREDRLSDKEKKMIAYHEAGHALAALLIPEADPLSKVTIIPRGRSLGATEQVPEEDRHNLSRSYLLGRICVMIGGRAAEEEVFDDVTSGAGDDLKNASQLARRMVCQWGMSEKVGLMVFKKGEPHPFLGRELTEDKDYSEATAEVIDTEIKTILHNSHDQVKKILQENREKLDQLAEELMDKETLTSEEIEELLDLQEEEKSE
ncbi:MAG TPA: ATP-dependent zinc metalloprotease FtsH, partial [Desulfotignum sp.]|nr:ATP-dependent zinc metalloprotease FtsH [Desulfotignum sp.]